MATFNRQSSSVSAQWFFITIGSTLRSSKEPKTRINWRSQLYFFCHYLHLLST